jgi:hypothetical protein
MTELEIYRIAFANIRIFGEVIDGEIVDDGPRNCSVQTSECTNDDVLLLEDPYEASVNDNPGVWILACPNCYQEKLWAI